MASKHYLYSLPSQEQADILFIYGFCNGNACAAAREYTKRFASRTPLRPRMFANAYRALHENGINRPSYEKSSQIPIETEEAILDLYEKDTRMSYRHIARKVGVSTSTVTKILQGESGKGNYFCDLKNKSKVNLENMPLAKRIKLKGETVKDQENNEDVATDEEFEPVAQRLNRKRNCVSTRNTGKK